MKRMVTMLALAAVIATDNSAGAITGNQPEFRKLADDVYVYVGKLNDSNAMAIVTTEGVVLVDTGNNTTDTRELLKHIQSVTSVPVRYVVITQNHNDHSGGAALFSPPATTIVHERVAKQWASLRPHQITAWRRRFPERTAVLERMNPVDTVQSVGDRLTLRLGGKEIQLIYVDDPYNPGDIAVWLPKERILHASMAGYKDRHPDIRPDYSHGTTAGLLKQLKAYLALRPEIVVPAHGPVGRGWLLEAMIESSVARARQGAGDDGDGPGTAGHRSPIPDEGIQRVGPDRAPALGGRHHLSRAARPGTANHHGRREAS